MEPDPSLLECELDLMTRFEWIEKSKSDDVQLRRVGLKRLPPCSLFQIIYSEESQLSHHEVTQAVSCGKEVRPASSHVSKPPWKQPSHDWSWPTA